MPQSKLERLARLSGKVAAKALETLEHRGVDLRKKMATPVARVPRRAPQKAKKDG